MDANTATLFSYLKPNVSFQTNFDIFFRTYQHGDILSACVRLADLAKEPRYLALEQRLICFFILHEVYRSGTQPLTDFIGYLAHMASDSENLAERMFIMALLSGKKPDNFHYVTPNDWLLQLGKGKNPPARDPLWNAMPPKQQPPPQIIKDGFIRMSVPREVDHTGVTSWLEPPWIRPIPSSLPILHGEMLWINPEPSADNSDVPTAVKHLFAKAFKYPLSEPEIADLKKAITHSSQLAKCGLNPSNFEDLINNNHILVLHILSKLLTSRNTHLYVDTIMNMNVSLQSLEIANQLNVDILKDFTRMYTVKCIAAIRANTEKPSEQNRMVWLLSKFLQKMLKSTAQISPDLRAEIQSFCMDYSKNKGSVELYHMLQTL